MVKLSKSDIREIMRLRRSGMITKNIAEKFGVCENTIDYHIYPKLNKSMRNYSKKYFMSRYRIDEEFRKRIIASIRKYQSKPEVAKNILKNRQSKKHKEYHREYSKNYRLKMKGEKT